MAVECRTDTNTLDRPILASVERIAVRVARSRALVSPRPPTSAEAVGRSSCASRLGDCRVVVKQQRSADRFDPSDATDFGPAERFWNEIVGLELLASRSDLAGMAPRLMGYTPKLGIVVLEDVGDHPSLADILLGTDPGAAERGLVAWGRILGSIHAATAGLSGLAEFEAKWERRAGRPAPAGEGYASYR